MSKGKIQISNNEKPKYKYRILNIEQGMSKDKIQILSVEMYLKRLRYS